MIREQVTGLQREVAALRAELALWKRDTIPQPVRYSAQQAAAAAGLYFGVVREIGTGAEHTIMVQRLQRLSGAPHWAFSEQPAQEVQCMPDTLSAAYEFFLCTAVTWQYGQAMRPILVARTDHGPVAIPWTAFALKLEEDVGALPPTDAWLPE